MFERRLRILLTVLLTGGVALVGRLFQLQVIEGPRYRERADAALLRAPQFLAPVRGRILDRNGLVLVSDEPTADLCVHYGVLAMRPAYLKALARKIRREPQWRAASVAQARTEARRRIRRMWMQLSEVCGLPLCDLADRREQICRRVDLLREAVWNQRRRQYPDSTPDRVDLMGPILEETVFHPVVRDVSAALRTQIELRLIGHPFVRLEPAVRRVQADRPAMVHVIGRLGQVWPARLKDDANAEDALARYRPGDLLGVSGIERLAESTLRGRRGIETRDLDGHVITRTPPRDGRDVRLTIDAALQREIFGILTEAIERPVADADAPRPSGAACAVLALPSREVLALVSCPAYEASAFRSHYPSLRDDTVRLPLRARAIAVEYPPGSIIKPAVLLTALAAGRIAPETSITCRGRLDPDVDAWRCWTYWRHLPPHGSLDCIGAIQHSCNVFFYTTGQRLGAATLTRGLRRILYGPDAGPGRSAWRGTGLVEERSGLIPSPSLLRRPFRLADARNYAIGQGELQITPLQAAHLMATVACGDYLPPLLLDPGHVRTPVRFDDVRPEHWEVVRTGLYRCVNEYGGTAYPHARMDAVSVCGKTGSAQSVPRIVERRYTFDLPVGTRATVIAPTVEAARDQLDLPATAKPVATRTARLWPAPVEGHDGSATHAWFAGYAPRHDPQVALAVVIEYGGSGGRVAAPVAKRIFEAIQRSPHGYLTADGRYRVAMQHSNDDAAVESSPRLRTCETPVMSPTSTGGGPPTRGLPPTGRGSATGSESATDTTAGLLGAAP